MPLNVTSTPALTPSTTQATTPAQGEVKSNVIAGIEVRQEEVANKLQNTVNNLSERWSNVEQFAEENDYSRLAEFAGRVNERVENTSERIMARVDRRFDVVQQMVEQRPQGGYSIDQETADAMSSKIEARASSRADQMNTLTAEILSKIEADAEANGLDGERVDSILERVETRLQESTNRIESQSQQALDLIQGIVKEGDDAQQDPLLHDIA